MKKRVIRYGLLTVMPFGTVLSACVDRRAQPAASLAVYGFFVLLPMLLLILLAFIRVRSRYCRLRSVLREWYPPFAGASRTQRQFFHPGVYVLHTYALEKSRGIHPNRAGPFPVLA